MKTILSITAVSFMIAMTGCVSSPKGSSSAAMMGQTPANAVSTISAIAGVPIANTARSSSAVAQTPNLVNLLVQQLGVSHQQASGGAGIIFAMAKQSMSPSSFGQISQAVPGMSQLLSAAPILKAATPAKGLIGSVANSLGAGNNVGRMLTMANSFQSIGLNSTMVRQFIPIILQYVQTQGGPATTSLLQSALAF